MQSSWFPLANLNPQRFLKINQATAADFRNVTQRVSTSKDAASAIRLSVLDR